MSQDKTADSGTRPRDIDAGSIRRELLRQGVYLSPAIEAADPLPLRNRLAITIRPASAKQ